MTRRIAIDGEVKSLSDWAKVAGVSYQAIGKRISKGLTGKALIAPRANPNPARRYECDGLRLTVSEWAERVGIKKMVIHQRLSIGWSPAQAFGFEPSPSEVRKQAKSKKAWRSCDELRAMGREKVA